MKLTSSKPLPINLAPRVIDVQITTELPPIGYGAPQTLKEIIEVGASALGGSAVSGYLSCPCRAQLVAAGVERLRREPSENAPEELDAADFGSVMHAVLPVRAIYGQAAALAYIDFIAEPEPSVIAMASADRIRAHTMLRAYDLAWPLDQEPFETLGYEVSVYTDLGSGRIRSARYDQLIRLNDQPFGVFNMDHKSSSGSLSGVIMDNASQRKTQHTIWNANAALVAKYGPMRGTIYNFMRRVQVPTFERSAPQWASPRHVLMGIDYLSLPDQINFPKSFDGMNARMLHACKGRYGACEFFSLCHEDNRGDYYFPEAP